jgi:hypothetical protein
MFLAMQDTSMGVSAEKELAEFAEKWCCLPSRRQASDRSDAVELSVF